MTWFLIKYHRKTGAVQTQTFVEGESAMRARIELERSASADEEVVVLSSDSEATLRSTHARYFESAAQILHDAADEVDHRIAV